MPWKACSAMEERLRFVARLLDGEAMTDVCREFGISRKTGYKILEPLQGRGQRRAVRPIATTVRYANQLPPQIEGLIVSLKRDKPHWGARKIRELLVRRLPGDLRVPAQSTIHAVLDRHGLVRSHRPPPESRPGHPAVSRRQTQRPLVRRLQRRVQARKHQLLLSAHRHRPRIALPAALRGPRLRSRGGRHRSLRATVPPSVACPAPSAPTTASPSQAPTPFSTSPSSPSGGFASASPSNASSRDTHSRTAATSACISPSRRKQPARPA